MASQGEPLASASDPLWVHCVALYIISGAAFILLYIEYKHIARLRLLHLTSTRSNPRHFTVLVRGKKSKEIENLAKEKQELQEKFAEKSRQKRKLDEMYDKLRTEYDSLKRSAIQPANNLFPRAQPELFAGMPNMMDSSNHLRQGMVFTPETPERRDEMWAPAPRQRLANSDTFEIVCFC